MGIGTPQGAGALRCAGGGIKEKGQREGERAGLYASEKKVHGGGGVSDPLAPRGGV